MKIGLTVENCINDDADAGVVAGGDHCGKLGAVAPLGRKNVTDGLVAKPSPTTIR